MKSIFSRPTIKESSKTPQNLEQFLQSDWNRNEPPLTKNFGLELYSLMTSKLKLLRFLMILQRLIIVFFIKIHIAQVAINSGL
jgi:hypothetical protein